MIAYIMQNNLLIDRKESQIGGTMDKIQHGLKKGLKPAQVLVLGFAGTILLGTLLLMLPISSIKGHHTAFIDAFFTSTSAVCVTGLVVVDTGTYWSTFGKLVIMLLIQVGGLGFMTMATSIAIILGKKISLRNRLIMQEALNQFSISGVIRLTRYIIMMTLGIEFAGAFLLSFRFIPEFGVRKGIFYSIFHSISAFCNAGFDVMGNGVSLTKYVDDPLVSIVIMILIVTGGLGFAVIMDLMRGQNYKRWTLHTKLVLSLTGMMIVIGFISVMVFEFKNPGTLGNLSLGGKILAAMFHSITPRTAGFNTLDMTKLSLPTILLTIMFMFVGGSPGSTAGGVKTTTFGVLILKVRSVIKGVDDVEFAHRRISKDIINRALAVFFIANFVVISVTMLLAITERGTSLEYVIFESMSAFGTVGLSLGLTPSLSIAGKAIVSAAMFFGRLGPLTIVLALSNRDLSKRSIIRYPEGKVIVG